VGVALSHHEQDFHAHIERHEIYLFFGNGKIRYEENGEIKEVSAGPGDIIIVEPGTFHSVNLADGFAYVILVGRNFRDKILKSSG